MEELLSLEEGQLVLVQPLERSYLGLENADPFHSTLVLVFIWHSPRRQLGLDNFQEFN